MNWHLPLEGAILGFSIATLYLNQRILKNNQRLIDANRELIKVNATQQDTNQQLLTILNTLIVPGPRVAAASPWDSEDEPPIGRKPS
jgi:hypothetical protein